MSDGKLNKQIKKCIFNAIDEMQNKVTYVNDY